MGVIVLFCLCYDLVLGHVWNNVNLDDQGEAAFEIVFKAKQTTQYRGARRFNDAMRDTCFASKRPNLIYSPNFKEISLRDQPAGRITLCCKMKSSTPEGRKCRAHIVCGALPIRNRKNNVHTSSNATPRVLRRCVVQHLEVTMTPRKIYCCIVVGRDGTLRPLPRIIWL